MSMEHWWNGSDRAKLTYWEKNLPQYHFVDIYLTWTDLGLNLASVAKDRKQTT